MTYSNLLGLEGSSLTKGVHYNAAQSESDGNVFKLFLRTQRAPIRFSFILTTEIVIFLLKALQHRSKDYSKKVREMLTASSF